MLSEFHQAKLRRHHAVCDWDGSGAVTQQDFESIADRFAELRGEAPGSPVHQQLVDGFRSIWTTYWAPTDTSNDGEVTTDEFIAGITAAVDAGVRSDDVLLPLLYEMTDADGSGQLSPEEHARFLGAFKISAEDAAATFAALDVDGDGVISKAEFIEAGAKFFFFDDPDAPGNLFWGPFEA
jgi:Ca2+-binding EF-hand superfamily protein